MMAEVNSAQFRAREKSTALITRDLLGGCSIDSTELELDSRVPYGWEKRLELESGNIYLQRCNSPTISSDQNDWTNGTISKQFNKFSDMSLDLKLVSSSSSPSPSSSITNYQSVCTLDKVKSALERAEREKTKKRSSDYSNNSYSSSSISEIKNNCDENLSPSSFATGCPNCLLYVLVSVDNPLCPRCNTVISSPFVMKKPRIDLNISM